MNKLTKIGLSALAGSLVAFSANAGSLSASGSASITFSDADVDNTQASTAEANQWSMADSITMTGSGELDNGMTVSVSFEIDNDETDAGDVLDGHSITLDTDGMGTLIFSGHGGSGALSAIDDKSPNAYEESWDGVTNGDEETVPGGTTGNNMFTYKSPDVGGATITVGYVPSGNTTTPAEGYTDFSVVASPEAVEGLTVGFGIGEVQETAGTTTDDTIMFATYAYGPVTAGLTMSESDSSAANSDVEFESYGVTFAVTDDFSIGYHVSESDLEGATNDQESSGISASYTSGGVTVGGMMNTVDNVSHGTTDAEGYEFNISFAF